MCSQPRAWFGAVAASLLAAAGCGPESPDCTLEPTPGGPTPKACIHEVPNGATVTTQPDGTTIVTLNGTVVAMYPPCPCPHP